MHRDGENILGRVKEVNSQEQSQKSRSRNIGQDFIDDFVVAGYPVISQEEELAMESIPNVYFF